MKNNVLVNYWRRYFADKSDSIMWFLQSRIVMCGILKLVKIETYLKDYDFQFGKDLNFF